MKYNKVFCLGPGKSATKTQAFFLNAQPGITAVHEGRFGILNHFGVFPDIVSWYDDTTGLERHISKLEALASCKQLFQREKVTTICEVAMYILPYVDYLLDKDPDTKFVCIKRDPEKIIQSWLDITGGHIEHWSNGGTKGYLPPATKIIGRHWDQCFPKYNLRHEEACRKYVYDYYEQVDRLELRYGPDVIQTFPLENLKTDHGKNLILDFIGYEGTRVIEKEFWEHKNRDLLKFFSGKI